MLQRSPRVPLALICALLLLPLTAFAAPTMTIRPGGDGVFVVSGASLETYAGVQLLINYDASQLARPRVTKGGLLGSAMFVVNDQPAGTLRIAAIQQSPFASSGVVVTIAFDRLGSSPGTITNFNGTAANASGSSTVQVATSVVNPDSSAVLAGGGGSGDSTSQGSSGSGSGTTGTGSSTPTVGGTLTMPGQEPAAKDAQPAQQETSSADAAPAVAPESAPGTEPPAAEGTPPQQVAKVAEKGGGDQSLRQALQSIPERFRLYQGEHTVQKLTALFERGELASYSQDPPIAVSDGEAILTVTIRNPAGDTAPNFAFNGAHHVSMQKTADGAWQVQAKPIKGAVYASISVLADGVLREFPLTVTPKARVDLLKRGTVTEADFQLFLKERGTVQAPKYDLNGDGKRDYLDEYIFTANYLLAKEKERVKVPSPKKVQGN